MNQHSSPTIIQRLGVVAKGHQLLLVLGIACIVRLILWAQPLHEAANDEVEYITVAHDLLAGRGWIFYESYRWLRAPLYPLFLAGSLWVASGDLHRAALPNLILSLINVGLTYLLTRSLVGRGPAILAALLAAILWTNATFASLYMAETLFTCLFLSALLITLRIPKTNRPLRLALCAGVVYGLAALTRSALLPFIPFVIIWLWRAGLANQKSYNIRSATCLLLLAGTFLTITPWTIRNTLAYGRPILIETGLSYNLWAFNEPGIELDSIHRTLEAIPNPAERSDYATSQGLSRLRTDPAILVRKIWPNWVFLTRIKPIQDRFLMESYYDSIDLPLFSAALIFDDLLYILIALAAIVALIRWPTPAAHPNPNQLTITWLILIIATFLLTHGEARYRHFLFPILLPYAATMIWNARGLRIWGRERAFAPHAPRPRAWFIRPAIALTLAWFFCWNIITSYPYTWAGENITRGWYTLIGDLARRLGQPQTAMQAYRAAADIQRVPDPLLRLGETARTTGDTASALAAYRSAQRLIPAYVPAAARLGDLLRALGDQHAAQAAFAAPYIDQQTLSAWAWRNLTPAPRSMLDIGGGLDIGYTNGLYPAELLAGATTRWSETQATIRISPTSPQPATLILRLAIPRPGSPQPATRIHVCIVRQCQSLDITSEWRIYRIPLSTTAFDTITLTTPTFPAPDGRILGVLVDWVEVR